ncbi:MAG TPA: MASE1 domain-containing protein [Xanthobacteraceae bacterium]|nr:MASE1 domain-containing protein [Xanthobacteraceae bacterium]
MTEAGTGAARFPALSAVLSAVIYAIELAIIAASYFSLAESALLLPTINPAATPLWPPTGVALAFVLLRGYRVWPAILVSSFSANAISSGTMTASWLFQSTSIAIGTTLAALAGAWLINHRSHGAKTFFTPLGIGRFVLIAFVPTAITSSASAILGQLSTSDLNLSSLVVPSVSWWLADAAGTILIAPVIVLWAMPPRQAVAKWDLLETTAILVAAAVIGTITFIPVTIGAFNELLSQQRQFSFLILLPLIWAGLRGNQRAAATAALIFCGLAAWSSPPDASGSLAATGLNGSFLFLLALSISTSVASLLLSAVIAGYRDTQEGAKRRFQIFVESVSDYAIFVLDPFGHVASWNSTAQKIIGYTSEEIVGKHFGILYRPDERRASVPIRALELAIQKGRHEVEGWRTRKNGTPFFVTGVLTAIRDDNANLIGFASVIRDATERRDTQEKLVEAREQLAMAQKMEAIGKLTGGIAHDFNNLLMIIGGNAQMFKRLLDPKLPRAIEAIQTAAKRGESLTRQLLTFSRRQHLSPTLVDLNASIRNIRPMIESSLRGNIVYKEKIGPTLWPVKVDLAELELAIVNIAVNARDAMPNGGVFAVTANNVTANNDVDQNRQSADFVAVEFSDSGTGIPPDLLSKIFDPFFTTKDVGKGSGLGLSQVYGFAHQAGGTVHAESKVGLGTAISIYLPAYAGAQVDAPETSKREARHSQRPMVLIVDDSAEVAEVTSALFEQLGYETIYRDSAEAALNLLGNGAKIDLVFSDIVMPGTIDGVGLASEVRSLYPHLPVVLTTGYSDAAQAVPPNLPILRKPFDTDALRSFMQDMMDVSSAS